MQSFLNLDKIVILKIILSPCLEDINDRDKIPIVIFFEWGQDILSPCLVNINDGDKIPIVIFFEWGQDRKYKNHLVSMLSKY